MSERILGKAMYALINYQLSHNAVDDVNGHRRLQIRTEANIKNGKLLEKNNTVFFGIMVLNLTYDFSHCMFQL